MKDLKVWVRVGDQDDYHDFDSPELAAEHVHEYLHGPRDRVNEHTCNHEVDRHQGPGLRGIEIRDTAFTGCNGVSLFWGDRDAQLDCELSDAELFGFTNSLT